MKREKFGNEKTGMTKYDLAWRLIKLAILAITIYIVWTELVSGNIVIIVALSAICAIVLWSASGLLHQWMTTKFVAFNTQENIMYMRMMTEQVKRDKAMDKYLTDGTQQKDTSTDDIFMIEMPQPERAGDMHEF